MPIAGARLHGPNFARARITDGWLPDADISGDTVGPRINGVEVAPLVEAERDRSFPERRTLRARDPAGLGAARELIEECWRETMARAEALAGPCSTVGSTRGAASSRPFGISCSPPTRGVDA
jgi:hypothetical protein